MWLRRLAAAVPLLFGALTLFEYGRDRVESNANRPPEIGSVLATAN